MRRGYLQARGKTERGDDQPQMPAIDQQLVEFPREQNCSTTVVCRGVGSTMRVID